MTIVIGAYGAVNLPMVSKPIFKSVKSLVATSIFIFNNLYSTAVELWIKK